MKTQQLMGQRRLPKKYDIEITREDKTLALKYIGISILTAIVFFIIGFGESIINSLLPK